MQALQYLSVRYGVFQAVYSYWKDKVFSKMRMQQQISCGGDMLTFSVFVTSHIVVSSHGLSLFFRSVYLFSVLDI